MSKRSKLTIEEIENMAGSFVNILTPEITSISDDEISNGLVYIQRVNKFKQIFYRELHEISENPMKMTIKSKNLILFSSTDKRYFTKPNEAEMQFVKRVITKGWEKTMLEVNEIINNL